MDPQQQVKEIVMMLDPENPNGPDAVFVVKRYMEKMSTQVKDKEKQIALLEAQLELRSKEKHDIINEKLGAENELKKEIARIKGNK